MSRPIKPLGLLIFSVISILSFGTLVLLPTASSLASSEHSEIYSANAAYRAGDFQKATKLYSQAMSKGLSNPALYYNLANAQYKSGLTGKAIANYRRALQLEPGNPDILANLAKVRASLGRSSTTQPHSVSRLLTAIRTSFGLRQIQIGFLLSYGLLWLLWAISKNVSINNVFFALGFALCLSLGFSLFFLAEQASGQYSINLPLIGEQSTPCVVLNKGTAHSGDGESFAAVFRVAPGDELISLNQRNSWVKVRTDSGRLGWLPVENVEVLYTQ